LGQQRQFKIHKTITQHSGGKLSFKGEYAMNKISTKLALLMTILMVLAWGNATTSVWARENADIAMILWREMTEAEKGFQAELNKSKKFNFKYTVLDANQSKTELLKILDNLDIDKYRLIYSFGTTVTKTVKSKIADKPIVFNIVSRPVKAKIIDSWDHSGSNVTGASNAVPMASAFNTLSKVMYIGRLGFVYNPKETNSRIQRDEDMLLETILALIEKHLQVNRCSLMIVDKDRKHLRIKKAFGIDDVDIKKIKVPLGEGIAGYVATGTRPLLIKDIATEQHLISQVPQAENFRTNSLLSVPLVAQEQIIGVINVNNRKDGRPFTEDDMELLSKISSEIAAVLQRSYMALQLKKARELDKSINRSVI
jgi:putative methionine-R-sulfoxide reductase with GAF domain